MGEGMRARLVERLMLFTVRGLRTLDVFLAETARALAAHEQVREQSRVAWCEFFAAPDFPLCWVLVDTVCFTGSDVFYVRGL